MHGLRRTLSIAVLFVIIGSLPAWAQTQTGEIFGRVTDRTGAILPGATITITATSLLQPLTAVAAASGAYRFPNLPVGS
ncbi:MAG: carboxypeptidase-like regulatory domain-containing protein [Acidimicrobiia bacterium]